MKPHGNRRLHEGSRRAVPRGPRGRGGGLRNELPRMLAALTLTHSDHPRLSVKAASAAQSMRSN